MQITISELKQYLKCPRSYKLKEIEEPSKKTLSQCRNNALRKIIAELYTTKPPHNTTKQEINTLCERFWDEEIIDPKVDKTELSSVVVQAKSATKKRSAAPEVTKEKRMLGSIKNWIFEFSREEKDVEVLYNNIYFQTVIGDITFVGWIDQVRKVNNHLQILVFNTSCQPPHNNFLQRDFSSCILAHAVRHGSLYPEYPNMSEPIQIAENPSVAIYYFPYLDRYQKKQGKYNKGDRKGNPLIDISKSEKEFLDLEYEILYATSAIQNDFFPAQPNSISCSLCLYSHACRISNVLTDTSFDTTELEKETVSCN